MKKFEITPEWCAAMAAYEGDAEIGAGSPDHPLRQAEQECPHEWEDIESMGNNEYRTDVRCVHCRMPGERDHADGSVFWPAT